VATGRLAGRAALVTGGTRGIGAAVVRLFASEGAAVVVAGRGAPDAGWFEGGWESVTLELPLSPLSAQESRVLLERLGLAGAAAQN